MKWPKQHEISVDINVVLCSLQGVVNEFVNVDTSRLPGAESGKIYDLSNIDFDLLKADTNSQTKNTSVQTLKAAVERQ